jgi:hypothetical protein
METGQKQHIQPRENEKYKQGKCGIDFDRSESQKDKMKSNQRKWGSS